MPATIESSTSTLTKPKQSIAAPISARPKRYWLGAVFIAALAVRLWFAFADGHSAIVFSCDASEYLRDARGLSQLIGSPNLVDSMRLLTEKLSSDETALLRQNFAPVKELAIAGPIFPLLLWTSFATFGVPVAQVNWAAPVIFQAIISAMTCALIAFIGHAAWGRRVGIAAGAIACLYPAFIVNSIRMYSESFSCFLLCAVVALAIPVVRKEGMFHSITAGVCLAFLQLTRSVMILVTGLTFVLTAWLSPGRSRVLRLLGLITGLAIVFAPWLLFQQLAFGKSSVVVDRVGHYNLFIGTNTATQGYLSYPYPDGRGIEKKTYATLVGAQIKESPERFARLMLDKPLRLLKYPWNDFRTSIGIFNIDSQVIYHQLMLAFAAIGASLCLFERSINEPKLRLRMLLVTLLAMHVVYLAFITVPRYNLTSMPFFILFSAAGLVATFSALRKPKSLEALVFASPGAMRTTLSRTAAIVILAALAMSLMFARTDWFTAALLPLGASATVSLAVASLIKAFPLIAFFSAIYIAASQLPKNRKFVKFIPMTIALVVIPLCALPMRSHGRVFEWALSADSSHTAKQFITIPREKRETVAQRDCYILVDCLNWQALGNDGHVFVNGVELNGPMLPVMPFAQDLSQMKTRGNKPNIDQKYLECEDIYTSLTAAAGGGNLDLRQWFAIPVPRSIIATALQQEEPGFNVELDQKQATNSDVYGSYCDARDTHVRIPSVARYSWEKAFYGVESEDGFTDSRYDDKIPVVRSGRLRSAGDTTSWVRVPNIRLLVAPAANSASSRMQAVQSKPNQPNLIALSSSQLPIGTPNDVWLASVNLQLDSLEKESRNIPVSFNAVFESVDKNGVAHRYRTPWTPTSIVSSPGNNHLRFAFPIQPSALEGSLNRVSIECSPGGVANSNDYFGVNGIAKSRVQRGALDRNHKIESMSLELYDLPANPIGSGYEVL